MKQALIVFIGGGFGSVLRYLIGRFLGNFNNLIPYGTFTVNILGSLMIGLVLGYFAKPSIMSSNYVLILATGFCGGFTTFSAFAYENHVFLKNGDYLTFLGYTISSVILGLLAVFIGFYFSKVF